MAVGLDQWLGGEQTAGSSDSERRVMIIDKLTRDSGTHAVVRISNILVSYSDYTMTSLLANNIDLVGGQLCLCTDLQQI